MVVVSVSLSVHANIHVNFFQLLSLSKLLFGMLFLMQWFLNFFCCRFQNYRGSSICVASIYVISVLRRYCLQTINQYTSSKIRSCVIFSSPRYPSNFDVYRIPPPKSILPPTQKKLSCTKLNRFSPESESIILIDEKNQRYKLGDVREGCTLVLLASKRLLRKLANFLLQFFF